MQTILMYLCFAGLAVAVPACAVMWLHEKGLYPIRDAMRRFRRLPALAQIMVLAFLVQMIVYGGSKGTTNAPPDGTSGDSTNQTSYVEGGTTNDTGVADGGTTNAPPDGASGGSTNQTSYVEGGTTNGVGGVDGGTTNAPPDGGSGPANTPPPMLGLPVMTAVWNGGDLAGEDTDGAGSASVSLPDVETISSQVMQGWIGTNETWDFSMPADATEVSVWKLRGACQDWQPVAVDGMSAAVLSDGRIWDWSSGDRISFDVFPAALGIVPEANWRLVGKSNATSRVWYRVTDYGSFVVTWQDVLFGRATNMPAQAQAEFYGNGSFIYRYDARLCGEAVTNVAAGVRFGTNDADSVHWHLATNTTSMCWYRYHPDDVESADRDGDGIPTADEVQAYGTDPGLVDTDGDGVSDPDEIRLGYNPRVGDSDGDGLVDGSDPDPLSATSLEDLDGDGIPDAYEDYWFGGRTGHPDAWHRDGTGFTLAAKIAAGVNPTNAPSSYHVETEDELVSWKLWNGFCADWPDGAGSVVFERTIGIRRDTPLQQYYLSSKPGEAGSWWLYGLTLEWEDSSGASGTATASPRGDSLYLPLGVTGSGSVTIRLVATGTRVGSPRQVYLVGYSPKVTVTGGNEVELSDGSFAYVFTDGTESSIGISIDRTLRPCKAGLYAGEQDMEDFAESLCGEDDERSYAGNVDGGTLLVSGLGAFQLPSFAVKGVANVPLLMAAAGGGSGGSWIVVLKPSVGWGEHHCYSEGLAWDGESYYRETFYPLDSKCLWRAWNTDATGGWGCSCQASVTSGAEDCPFVTTDIDVVGDTATGYVRLSGTVVWTGAAVHTADYTCGGGGWTLDSADECDDCTMTCENGNCGRFEGTSISSFKFRIPTGTPRQGQISGFVYFDTEGPVTMTPSVFETLFRSDSSTVESWQGSTRRIVCNDERGRTIAIAPVQNGVRITITTTATGALEHTWELCNVAGSPDTVRVKQVSRLDNVMSDETFEYAYDGADGTWRWRKTDNVSGIREELRVEDLLSGTEKTYAEYREKYDADGNSLGSTELRRMRIGESDSAIVRETYRKVVTGHNTLERFADYWEDPEHSPRNGSLRLLTGNDCAWEYHDWDSEGREILRVEQRNGSAVPSSWPWATAGGLSGTSGLSDAFVTVYDYTPFGVDDCDTDDRGRVRCETRYVVRGGAVTRIGRTWHTYRHVYSGGYPAVREDTKRAGASGAGFSSSGNAASYTVTFERTDDAEVPLVLRGTVADRLDENGLRTTSTVSRRNGRIVLTTRRSRSGVYYPTYDEEELDPAYGTTLRRATCLTGGAAVISEETCAYDEQNRLRSRTYLDGTSATNAYSCCRLLWSRDRNGRKVLRSAVTGEDHLYWAEEDVWLGGVQTNGHKVTQHFCDGFGRETNTVVYVAGQDGEATSWANSSGRELTVETAYYSGEAGDWSESTDARGKTTEAETRYYADREEFEQIASASDIPSASRLREVRTDYRNGRTVSRREWDGKWLERIDVDEYDAAGCRTSCEIERSSDYGTVTNRVVRYDFLGRKASVEEPDGTTTYGYVGNSGRRNTATFASGGATRVTATVFDGCGEAVGTVEGGVTEREDVGYEQDASNGWWKVVRQMSFAEGGLTNSVEETRVRLTGLGGEGGVLEEKVGVSALGVVTTTVRRKGMPGMPVLSGLDDLDGVEVETVSNSVAGVATAVSRYGLVLWRTTPDGTRRYEYDALGRMTAESKTVAGETLPVSLTTYTAQGDVASVLAYTNATAGALTQYGYDSSGRQTAETDALGNVTTTSYDGQGNVASVGGAAYSVNYGYDTSGRRTSLATTRNGAWRDTTSWTYDPATGHAFRKRYADGTQVATTHNAEGLVLRTTKASGAWKSYAYDGKGRPAAVTSSDGAQDAAFAYDAFGRQVAATGGVFGVAYRIGPAGVVTNECASVDGVEVIWERSLDGFGRVVGRGAAGGTWQSVAYDANGRIASLTTTNATITYGYGPDGTDGGSWVSVAGGTTVRRRILRDRFRGLAVWVGTFANGSRLKGYGCAYDALCRLSRRNGDAFAYNARSELTGLVAASAGSPATASYQYDGIGNFTAVQRCGATATFAANAVNEYGGLSYDSDGNLLGLGGLAFAYDSAGRLVSVSTGGVCVASYGYDPFDRRVMKTTAGATHRYFYDGWNLVQERIAHADGSSETVEYFWGKDMSGTLDGAGGIGGLVYVKKGGCVYVPVYDQGGNVVAYSDASGALVAEYEYDGFGNTVAESGSMADAFRFRYSTKYADPESGLVYYGYRYYAPELGRWLTRDPLEEQGGVNLYGFCGNNGLCRYDADGQILSIINDGRAFWRAVIAGYMLPRGLVATAYLLNHSLQFFPPDISLGSSHFISRQVKGSSEYQEKVVDFMYKAPQKYKSYSEVPIGVSFGDADRDLASAFGHATLYISGWTCRSGSGKLKCDLAVTLKDTYDFHWHGDDRPDERTLIKWGNNGAVVSQYLFIINSYDVTSYNREVR